MFKPKIIVAVNPQGIIAIDDKIPWKKPEDLKRFKEVTMGSVLICGRKTWESIGKRSLPGRDMVIVSRDNRIGKSPIEALSFAEEKDKPIWIIGGAEIIDLFLPMVDVIDLTLVLDFEDHSDSINITALKSYLQGFSGFKIVSQVSNPKDYTLIHKVYKRK